MRRETELFIIGGLIGLVLGAVLGLLFAPVSGRRLRRRIGSDAMRAAEVARELAGRTEQIAGHVAGRVDHYLGRDEEAAWRKIHEIREGVSRYSQAEAG